MAIVYLHQIEFWQGLLAMLIRIGDICSDQDGTEKFADLDPLKPPLLNKTFVPKRAPQSRVIRGFSLVIGFRQLYLFFFILNGLVQPGIVLYFFSHRCGANN